MQTTKHFEEVIIERKIEREWCERVVRKPVDMEVQPNGRICCWGFIEEKGRYLRVVLLDDGVTLHTTHFDRNFGKKKKP